MMNDSMTILFLILGTMLICVANLAIVIFKDVYAKNHVLTKAGTLGISLLLIVVSMRLDLTQFQAFELIICVVLQWLTIPLSGQYINYLEFLRRSKHQ